MAKPRVVVMNDTDVDGYHFGCQRVMALIKTKLSERGFESVETVPVGINWREVHQDLILKADLLVINGEGTLHHGSRKGRWLLEAGSEVKSRGGHVALINALWQDNPSDWSTLVKNFDVLSCRDSRSAKQLAKEVGREITLVGDMSMAASVQSLNEGRSGIVFGDSVHASITSRLADLSVQVADSHLVPVTSSLKFVDPALQGFRRSLRTTYAQWKQRQYQSKNPKAQFMKDEAAYLDMLRTKALSVTGRFHAVCLAIATMTPFVAVSSNSWKIEALLDDIGLHPDRIRSLDELSVDALKSDDWTFDPNESKHITSRLAEWSQKTDVLFDEIASLVS